MKCLLAALALFAAQDFVPEKLPLPSDPNRYGPLEKYEPMALPKDNPMSVEKASLGWQLFFDKRLSGDGNLSCYACHLNENGLTDGKALGKGAFDKPLTRSAPTLWNIGYHSEFYWDGRAKSLEGQAMAAWKGVNMGAKDEKEDKVRDDIIAKLNAAPGYRKQFETVFGSPASADAVTKALACYMRTIVSKTTAYDRWQSGDEKAVTDSAKRGFKVFEDAKCTNCHSGFLFTSQQYYNVGIGMPAEKPDLGRFNATKKDEDKGKFKAPTLRDVARSDPYFHDGSAATLEDAVKIMLAGGIDNPNIDKVNLAKQDLTPAQFADLIEFLKSLTETAELKAPKLPPDP